jgi:hypothetical protein
MSAARDDTKILFMIFGVFSWEERANPKVSDPHLAEMAQSF